jgi:hypothetical protein
VKALNDRPALRLDIRGRIDPELDRPGLREAALLAKLEAAKRVDLGGKGEEAESAAITITPEEYDRYLEKVYDDAEFEKPRNAVGFAKSLPPEEMKTLLLTNITVGDAELAGARRPARRRDPNAARGRVSPSRLFLTAAKLDAEGVEDKGKTTRVDFALR